MMISPESYLEEIKNKSYNELLIERSELLNEILDFEKNANLDKSVGMFPAPETIYQMNLLYLGKLCELLSKKYSLEFC